MCQKEQSKQEILQQQKDLILVKLLEHQLKHQNSSGTPAQTGVSSQALQLSGHQQTKQLNHENSKQGSHLGLESRGGPRIHTPNEMHIAVKNDDACVGNKRSSDDETNVQFKAKKPVLLARERSPPQEPEVDALQVQLDHPVQYSPMQSLVEDDVDPEVSLRNHLLRILIQRNGSAENLSHHFGIRAVIREWIALALSRRSFGLLSNACELAIKCGINMDMILSGADEAGGRMNYLLPMLLEPRSAQVIPVEQREKLTPQLPRSFLSYIAPSSCSSFGELDVKNRWITIREIYRGSTKFYCSPMFEKNVVCWTQMSEIYEEYLCDIFSLIFVEHDKVLETLAQQISAHHHEDVNTRPSLNTMMKIRLMSRGTKDAPITKEMLDKSSLNQLHSIHVDVSLSSIQTIDKHLVSVYQSIVILVIFYSDLPILSLSKSSAVLLGVLQSKDE